MKNIILASASPRRKALLEQIGLSFDVIVSKVSESTNSVHPEDVVKDLAYQKAKKVFDSHRDSIVIGADTVVYNDGKKLGKPTGYDNWKEMLRSLSGHRHYVYTGVCVLWCGENNNTHILSFAEPTKVMVHELSDEDINEYILKGEAIDKAGGYGIQGTFARFVDSIEGDYNNVVGLPVARLYQELKRLELI